MNNSIKNWKASTWRIRPALKMPDMDPEAVQIAILDSDLIENYRKTIVQNQDRLRKTIEDETDPNKRTLLKTAQMTSMWDQLFSATTGDKVYLFVPSRTKINQSLARTFVISSSEPAGRKWLSAKVAYCAGRPTCWCIEVDTVIGKEVQVVFCNENTVDLSQLYDQFLGTN